MRKIEEVLRLKYEVGLTHREIARSCAISASTVSEYVTHAKAAGLSWPLPEGLSGAELEALLFPEQKAASGGPMPQPDWAVVYKELRRKSVTLSLLWLEYREEQPEGYSYSQFCHHYRQWAKQLKPMMRSLAPRARQASRGGEAICGLRRSDGAGGQSGDGRGAPSADFCSRFGGWFTIWLTLFSSLEKFLTSILRQRDKFTLVSA